MDFEKLHVNNRIDLLKPQLNFSKAIFNIIQSERHYLQEWLTWVTDTHTEYDVRRFLRELQAFNEGGQQLTYFIALDQQIVGSVGFVHVNIKHRKAELGYWISKRRQGNGIITRSCRTLINHAFLNLAFNRIEIRVLAGNRKSSAIPPRLGFKHEGLLKQSIWLHNQYYDMAIYGLLQEDWNPHPTRPLAPSTIAS